MLAEARPAALADDTLTVEFPQTAAFHRGVAEEPRNATALREALYEVTGRRLGIVFAVGEAGEHVRSGRREEPRRGRAVRADEGDLRRERGGARRLTSRFDMNKLMQQAQQMQEQMAQAQEEIANEVVEASAGGGMVSVKANGAGEVLEIRIDPKAIDPDDPEMLADPVLAAVNEALRSAQPDGVEAREMPGGWAASGCRALAPRASRLRSRPDRLGDAGWSGRVRR